MDTRHTVAWLTAVLLGVCAQARAQDWPQFRGPQGTGIADEAGLARSWAQSEPTELWRRPLGAGFASLVVAGDQIYALFADGDDEVAAGFRVADGTEVWRRRIGKTFVDHWGNGPRSTPVIAGGSFYALASNGALHALRAADGQTIWEVDLEARFGSPNRPVEFDEGAPPGHVDMGPYWGFCSSLLVEGELLIAYTGSGDGNTLVALDRSTGEQRWGRLDHRTSYSSPFTVTIGGQRQIIVTVAGEIVSLSPSGELLWRHPWARFNVSQPVFIPPDKLFFSSSNDVGALLLAVGAGSTAALEVWRQPRMRNNWQSSVAHQDAIVGFDNATLKLLSLGGEIVWAKRGLGKGTLVLADDLLFLLSDRGVLTMAEWSLEGFRQVGQRQVLSDTTMTAPTLAQGKLFLRNHQEMVCFDLKQKPLAITATGSPE